MQAATPGLELQTQGRRLGILPALFTRQGPHGPCVCQLRPPSQCPGLAQPWLSPRLGVPASCSAGAPPQNHILALNTFLGLQEACVGPSSTGPPRTSQQGGPGSVHGKQSHPSTLMMLINRFLALPLLFSFLLLHLVVPASQEGGTLLSLETNNGQPRPFPLAAWVGTQHQPVGAGQSYGSWAEA